MSAMTVFTYWLLIASWQMGVPMLNAILTPNGSLSESSWAGTCISCEPKYYEATRSMLEYGNHEFIKLVAYHEVCHVFLEHKGVYIDSGDDVSVDEISANKCAAEYAGVTVEDIRRLDAEALEWDRSGT